MSVFKVSIWINIHHLFHIRCTCGCLTAAFQGHSTDAHELLTRVNELMNRRGHLDQEQKKDITDYAINFSNVRQ